MIIFVTGGVRSGKSSYAEQLAKSIVKEECRLIYIATSNAEDEEMKKRVKRHQLDRNISEANWITYEQSRSLELLLPMLKHGDVILLDCLTNLVSNELFYDWYEDYPQWQDRRFRLQLKERIIDLVKQMKEKNLTLIIVSNELFQSPMLDDKGTLYYMELLGYLHQEIVKLADRAVLVEYGIPIVMKKEGE